MGKRKWAWVGSAVLGCVIVLIAIVLRPPAKPEAEIVFIEAEKVLKEPNRLQRWVGALRAKLVKPPAVKIMTDIVSSDRLTSLEEASELFGSEPLARKEGVQVWILSQSDLERVAAVLVLRRANLVANPQMMMDEGQIGSTFIGRSLPFGGTNMDVGLTIRMKAFGWETNTDLFLGVMHTEAVTRSNEVAGAAVRTNIQIAARVQLPTQQRVLFVCDRNDGERPVCVFVYAWWQP